jgi:hypothetical protein
MIALRAFVSVAVDPARRVHDDDDLRFSLLQLLNAIVDEKVALRRRLRDQSSSG